MSRLRLEPASLDYHTQRLPARVVPGRSPSRPSEYPSPADPVRTSSRPGPHPRQPGGTGSGTDVCWGPFNVLDRGFVVTQVHSGPRSRPPVRRLSHNDPWVTRMVLPDRSLTLYPPYLLTHLRPRTRRVPRDLPGHKLKEYRSRTPMSKSRPSLRRPPATPEVTRERVLTTTVLL